MTKPDCLPSKIRWKPLINDIGFIVGALSVLFFTLSGWPLWVPDDARYAEIAREMVVSHDYITPHLNSLEYFEKPALFYWLLSLAIHWGGLHLTTLRAVNGIVGLVGCLATYAIGRGLYSRSVGLLSAFMLGTSLLYFLMVHVINLDLSLSVFLSLSLYAFLWGLQKPLGFTRRFYIGAAFIFSALAVMTKGLIGIVFPCLIVFLWIVILRNVRLLKSCYFVSSFFLFLLVALPWHLLLQHRHPEFFNFYFINQQFLRYATLEANRYQPIWFFIPILLLGFFPWVVFLPQTLYSLWKRIKKSRTHAANELFLIIWAGSIFIFYSFSKSKLIPYILPVMPPLALLTAQYLVERFSAPRSYGLRIGFLVLTSIASTIMVLFILFTLLHWLPDGAGIYFVLASILLCIGCSLANYLHQHQKMREALIAMIFAISVFSLLLLPTVKLFNQRSLLPLTTALKPHLTQNDEVVAYRKYYQDLPFYLERRIVLVDVIDELDFGMEHEDTRGWVLNQYEFLNHWHQSHRVFAFTTIDEYQRLQFEYPNEKIILIKQSGDNVLISNSPWPPHAL